MRPSHFHGAEAHARFRQGAEHQEILSEVQVRNDHPAGSGRVHLTAEQALYAQSRLSLIAAAFLHGHREPVHGLAVDMLPSDHRSLLGRTHVRVWPICHEIYDDVWVLDEVVLESEHPDGDGMVHLSPEQAGDLHRQLTAITMRCLHENRWGGEDARAQ
jgi:hypothetical protein